MTRAEKLRRLADLLERKEALSVIPNNRIVVSIESKVSGLVKQFIYGYGEDTPAVRAILSAVAGQVDGEVDDLENDVKKPARNP